MAEVVRMPKLSDTMTEGVVAEWHKDVGDEVKSGDLLAEIETDKATMEFESFQDGVLLHKGVEKGKAAPVDSILAILGEKGENIDDILKEDEAASSKSEDKSSAAETSEDKSSSAKASEDKEEPKKEERKPEPVPAGNGAAKKPEPQPVTKTREAAQVTSAPVAEGRLKVSPLAKRLAEEKGINLSTVRGSGDHGRIVKRDVENYSPGIAVPAFVGTESYRDEDVSQMRKTIARRLSESKFSAPHFYLTIDIEMEKVAEARSIINQEAEVKISFNDFVVKAAAAALRKHPKVNASWFGDTIRYYDHIHVGVAVAVEEGLLVPVIRFADGKTLSQIGTEVKMYAEKARNKKLQPEDWEGNTFTISNLGMFGIEDFTAIINPPDACIMAVGAVRDVPVVKDGQIMPGKRMKVTLSCDHRVVDGAKGSEFLATFKKFLENPVLLLGQGAI